MNKQLLKDTIGWGVLIWFIGYVLGIMLFAVVPHSLIGWTIMPIGILVTLYILIKKIKSRKLKYYLLIAVSWTLVAIIFDYLFLVNVFKPADGYYKLDVYLYYSVTFILPIIAGWQKQISKIATI